MELSFLFSHCSLSWSSTGNPPASISQVLKLQAEATMVDRTLHFSCIPCKPEMPPVGISKTNTSKCLSLKGVSDYAKLEITRVSNKKMARQNNNRNELKLCADPRMAFAFSKYESYVQPPTPKPKYVIIDRLQNILTAEG